MTALISFNVFLSDNGKSPTMLEIKVFCGVALLINSATIRSDDVITRVSALINSSMTECLCTTELMIDIEVRLSTLIESS